VAADEAVFNNVHKKKKSKKIPLSKLWALKIGRSLRHFIWLACMQQLPQRLVILLTSSSSLSTSGFLVVLGRVFSTAGRTVFTSSCSWSIRPCNTRQGSYIELFLFFYGWATRDEGLGSGSETGTSFSTQKSEWFMQIMLKVVQFVAIYIHDLFLKLSNAFLKACCNPITEHTHGLVLSQNLDPDPDRRQNRKSDPDPCRHQHVADPQHGFYFTAARKGALY
jgi:hypothetical protein